MQEGKYVHDYMAFLPPQLFTPAQTGGLKPASTRRVCWLPCSSLLHPVHSEMYIHGAGAAHWEAMLAFSATAARLSGPISPGTADIGAEESAGFACTATNVLL